VKTLTKCNVFCRVIALVVSTFYIGSQTTSGQTFGCTNIRFQKLPSVKAQTRQTKRIRAIWPATN